MDPDLQETLRRIRTEEEWLNDEGINLFLKDLEGSSPCSPLLAFNSYFYPLISDPKVTQDKIVRAVKAQLEASGHPGKTLAGAAPKLILFPIHEPGHWTLFTMDYRTYRFTYYDSLPGPGSEDTGQKVASRITWALEQIPGSKALELDEFVFVSPKNIPKQCNGSDCGVFACQYALNQALNKVVQRDSFRARDIPEIRKTMAQDLTRSLQTGYLSKKRKR